MNCPDKSSPGSHRNVVECIGELAKGIGPQKKNKSIQDVLGSLLFSKEDREQLALSLRYLDEDQREALLESAWEIGSAKYKAELAEDNSLLILANAIERTLRSEEASAG